MRYQKKWINRFMIYQKIFVDILLLFNGMILNYLYFHFYDSRYILRLSKFQKMLTVCLLALMFVFVYSDFGYCSYIFTSLLGFLFIRSFYHFEEKSEYITQVVFFFILMFSDLFASIFTNLIIRFFDMQRNSVLELSYFSILLTTLIIIGAVNVFVPTVREFSFPLLIGIAAGAYSSIFIASPIWVILKNKMNKKKSVKTA